MILINWSIICFNFTTWMFSYFLSYLIIFLLTLFYVLVGIVKNCSYVTISFPRYYLFILHLFLFYLQTFLLLRYHHLHTKSILIVQPYISLSFFTYSLFMFASPYLCYLPFHFIPWVVRGYQHINGQVRTSLQIVD